MYRTLIVWADGTASYWWQSAREAYRWASRMVRSNCAVGAVLFAGVPTGARDASNVLCRLGDPGPFGLPAPDPGEPPLFDGPGPYFNLPEAVPFGRGGRAANTAVDADGDVPPCYRCGSCGQDFGEPTDDDSCPWCGLSIRLGS
jgi:hypothetical protein